MTYLLVATLLLLVAATGLAAYWRGEAREARTETDRLARIANATQLGKDDTTLRLERVIADQRREILALMEDLDSCVVRDPAVVRDRLRRVLSPDEADRGGAGTAVPPGGTAGRASGGAGGAT